MVICVHQASFEASKQKGGKGLRNAGFPVRHCLPCSGIEGNSRDPCPSTFLSFATGFLSGMQGIRGTHAGETTFTTRRQFLQYCTFFSAALVMSQVDPESSRPIEPQKGIGKKCCRRPCTSLPPNPAPGCISHRFFRWPSPRHQRGKGHRG